MTAGSVGHRTGPFIATKEYRRYWGGPLCGACLTAEDENTA